MRKIDIIDFIAGLDQDASLWELLHDGVRIQRRKLSGR
jgi:hypothetical protein